MRTFFHLGMSVFLLATAVFLVSCGLFENDGEVMEVEGMVEWVGLDGTCWTIEGSDGQTYEVINLPSEFKQDDLMVWAHLKWRRDLFSICMVGIITEVLEIHRIDD